MAKRPIIGDGVILYGVGMGPTDFPSPWPPLDSDIMDSIKEAMATNTTADPVSIFDDPLLLLQRVDEALDAHPTVTRKRLIAAIVAAAEEDLVGLAGVLAADDPACCPSSGEPHGMHAPGCGESECT